MVKLKYLGTTVANRNLTYEETNDMLSLGDAVTTGFGIPSCSHQVSKILKIRSYKTMTSTV